MPTKKELEALLAEQQETMKLQAEQIAEAKRQQTHIPVRIGAAEDDGGSFAIDHLDLLDNHEMPDTNKEPREDIEARDRADLSFWNNSWTWVEAERSYGNKPEDRWFINPTPKLIAEVMKNAPTIFSACEVGLIAGNHAEELQNERERHLEFYRSCNQNEIISEALDMLTAYQSRYFESVQRYLGLATSYANQASSPNVNEEQLEEAKLRKEAAGAQCRSWVAKLIALKEAYHAIMSDERSYNLTFNFSPTPPAPGKTPSKEFNIFRFTVSNTLNKVGRRLATSIKSGKMDAAKYRIPRPWLDEAKVENKLDADEMVSDFY